jgi:hypothetical protein
LGFNISFFAAKVAPDVMASLFKLPVVRVETELPMDYWWAATVQKTGWTILWSEDFDFGQANEGIARTLSASTEVLLCEVDVNVAYSSVWSWSGGKLSWKVAYFQETDSIDDLEVFGELPGEFASVQERLIALQKDLGEGVDTAFSLPLSIAEGITGFVYDKYFGPEEMSEYLVLNPPDSRVETVNH